MSGGRRLPLGFLALAALVLLSGCVDYPPNPTVCLSCELGVEHAAGDRLNVSVAHSELRIEVDEGGDGHWTARSELSGPDVSALGADPALVDRLADRAVTDSLRHRGITHPAIHGGEVRNVSGQFVDDALVITFTVRDMADRGLGPILLVDFFHSRGRSPAAHLLGTDRLVVEGPPGTVVTNHPPGAAVEDGGRVAVWRSADTPVSGDTYVAFGPEDRRMTRLASETAIARDVAGWATPSVLTLGLPFAAILLGVVTLLTRHLADRWPIRIGSPSEPVRSRLASDPPVDIGVVVLLVALGSAGIVADYEGFRGVFDTVFPALALGLFGLLGYTIDRSRRASRSLAVAIAGLPVLLASGHAVTTPGFPLDDTVYATDSLLVAVVGLIVLGSPIFSLVLYWRGRP